MKLYGVVLVLLLMFSSCAQIYMVEPQPQKGMVIKSFIDQIQGEYSNENLSLTIHEREVIVAGLSFKLSAKTPIENEVLVKFYREYYFANFFDKGAYVLVMAKFYDDKVALYLLSPDARTVKQLTDFGAVAKMDSLSKSYLMTTTKKQFDQLLDYEMLMVEQVLEKNNPER